MYVPTSSRCALSTSKSNRAHSTGPFASRTSIANSWLSPLPPGLSVELRTMSASEPRGFLLHFLYGFKLATFFVTRIALT